MTEQLETVDITLTVNQLSSVYMMLSEAVDRQILNHKQVCYDDLFVVLKKLSKVSGGMCR